MGRNFYLRVFPGPNRRKRYRIAYFIMAGTAIAVAGGTAEKYLGLPKDPLRQVYYPLSGFFLVILPLFFVGRSIFGKVLEFLKNLLRGIPYGQWIRVEPGRRRFVLPSGGKVSFDDVISVLYLGQDLAFDPTIQSKTTIYRTYIVAFYPEDYVRAQEKKERREKHKLGRMWLGTKALFHWMMGAGELEGAGGELRFIQLSESWLNPKKHMDLSFALREILQVPLEVQFKCKDCGLKVRTVDGVHVRDLSADGMYVKKKTQTFKRHEPHKDQWPSSETDQPYAEFADPENVEGEPEYKEREVEGASDSQ